VDIVLLPDHFTEQIYLVGVLGEGRPQRLGVIARHRQYQIGPGHQFTSDVARAVGAQVNPTPGHFLDGMHARR